MSEGIFGKNADLAQRLKDRIAFHANEHRHTYEIGKGVMDALVLDLLADFRDAGGVILPVKPNGTVWLIRRRRVVSATVMFVGAGADGLTSFSVLRGRLGTTTASSGAIAFGRSPNLKRKNRKKVNPHDEAFSDRRPVHHRGNGPGADVLRRCVFRRHRKCKRTTRPGNAVSGLPGAFWNPFRNGNSSGAGTGMDRSRGDRVLSM